MHRKTIPCRAGIICDFSHFLEALSCEDKEEAAVEFSGSLCTFLHGFEFLICMLLLRLTPSSQLYINTCVFAFSLPTLAQRSAACPFSLPRSGERVRVPSSLPPSSPGFSFLTVLLPRFVGPASDVHIHEVCYSGVQLLENKNKNVVSADSRTLHMLPATLRSVEAPSLIGLFVCLFVCVFVFVFLIPETWIPGVLDS